MSETATTSKPTQIDSPSRVDVTLIRPSEFVKSEALGQSQREYLARQEALGGGFPKPWEVRRNIKKAALAAGRDIIIARRVRQIISSGETVMTASRRSSETVLASLDESGLVVGADVKDNMMQAMQDGPEAIAGFLKANRTNSHLVELFGRKKKLSSKDIAFASLQLAQIGQQIGAHAAGIDEIQLRIHKMESDKTRAYKASGRMKALAASSVTLAVLKTAGIRAPLSVVRRIPGVGGAIAGAAYGAYRANITAGMRQVHEQRSSFTDSVTLEDSIGAIAPALEHESMSSNEARHKLRILLPRLQMERESGVALFARQADKLHTSSISPHGGMSQVESTYTQEEYFEVLMSRLVQTADIGSMSPQEKSNFRIALSQEREKYEEYVQEEQRKMKKERARAAVKGATIGAVAGFVGSQAIHHAPEALSGIRDLLRRRSNATEALNKAPSATIPSRPLAEKSSTGSRPAATTPTTARVPEESTESRTPTRTTEPPGGPISPAEQPVKAQPIPPESQPAAGELVLSPARAEIVQSLSNYEVQPGDNIWWIVKDHMLKGHPELTYGQLDEPEYASRIQSAIDRLAAEKGVSVESLNEIHPGENLFNDVDTQKVFGEAFGWFDQQHPQLAPQEAAHAIFARNPDHVIVNIPVDGISGANMQDVVGRGFEKHLQSTWGMDSLQAHETAQELMSPKSGGYIPEGSLLDFINRGPIGGQLLVHYNPDVVLGEVTNWRMREYALPSTVSLDQARNLPEAHAWIRGQLSTYRALRGLRAQDIDDSDVEYIYAYMQEHNKRSLTIDELDGLYEQMQNASVGAPQEPEVVVPVPENNVSPDPTTPSEKIQEALDAARGDSKIEGVKDWWDSYGWQAAAGMGGGVAVVGGIGLGARKYARSRKLADSPIQPPAGSTMSVPPVAPPSAPRVAAPSLARIPDAVFASPEAPAAPPAVPVPDVPPVVTRPVPPLHFSRPPIKEVDSDVVGLTSGELAPLDLDPIVAPGGGESMSFEPPAKGADGDAYEDWVKQMVQEVQDAGGEKGLVGLSWKAGNDAHFEVVTHDRDRVAICKTNERGEVVEVMSATLPQFVEQMTSDLAAGAKYESFKYVPTQTEGESAVSESVQGDASDVPEQEPTALDLSTPATLVGQTIYLDGAPITVEEVFAGSNNIGYRDADGKYYVRDIDWYLDHLIDGKLSVEAPHAADSDVQEVVGGEDSEVLEDSAVPAPAIDDEDKYEPFPSVERLKESGQWIVDQNGRRWQVSSIDRGSLSLIGPVGSGRVRKITKSAFNASRWELAE